MEFVHIVDDMPDEAGGEPLPMLVGLHGFLDAGNAGTLAVDHLVEQGAGPVVATFDVDAFHDYRARRPGDLVRPRPLRGLRRAAPGGAADA